MRIYFFFFCPRIANLLSLFYTGKGFFLFFRFSAVGHGFSLLIIEEKRGWKRKGEEEKRKKEERRGGWRRQGEAEEDRKVRSSPTPKNAIQRYTFLPQLVTERYYGRQPE